MSVLNQRKSPALFLLLFFFAVPLEAVHPGTVLLAAPAILFASVLIAWAAESAQFFIAQGFALAILAWLQTLPEFAVEAVLAWKQQVPLLLANLTGALRLLTGFGWPVIYLTAAMTKRGRGEGKLSFIQLDKEQCVEVIGLIGPLAYMSVITIKGTLSIYDGLVLTAIYVAYLIVLSKMPPEDPDEIHELDFVPRTIVTAPRFGRIFAIAGLFTIGGLLIYFSAEPFLASLLAISASVGIPQFVFVQWVAPLVSEFPEMASTFYWARTVEKAPMALMNMVSSNINQWTLLPAMLAGVYAYSVGAPAAIVFDDHQRLELVLTLGQAVIGVLFLINMRLAWWEALLMLIFFAIPFADSDYAPPIAILQFVWVGIQVVRMIARRRAPEALTYFGEIWREHVRPSPTAATRRSS